MVCVLDLGCRCCGRWRRNVDPSSIVSHGVSHGIEHILGAGHVGRGTLRVRLITCGINLLWSIKIHKYRYTYVENVHRMQLWGKGLSGLKQDGPNRYLGAGQQLWSTFPKRVGWAKYRRYSQIVGRLQMHKQRSDLIRIQLGMQKSLRFMVLGRKLF